MSRHTSRTDLNQTQIVASFRKLGCSVQVLSAVGGGCPDICVGFQDKCYMVEIKNGDAPKSQRKLTPAQVIWHDAWLGSVHIIESISDVHSFVIANSKT